MKKYLTFLAVSLGIFLAPHFSHAAVIYSQPVNNTTLTGASGNNFASNPFVGTVTGTVYARVHVNSLNGQSGAIGNGCAGTNYNVALYDVSGAYQICPDAMELSQGAGFTSGSIVPGDVVFRFLGASFPGTGTSGFAMSIAWQIAGQTASGPGWGDDSALLCIATTEAEAWDPLCGATPPAPTLSFTWPNEGSTTVLFDNFLLKAQNVTSSAAYEIRGSWYLGFTQHTTSFTPLEVTGAQIQNGVLIPFTGFPNVCPTGNTCTFVALPVSAEASLSEITPAPYAENEVASTSVAFNIDAQGNTTSTTSIFINVTNSTSSPGTPVVATTTSDVNPFYSTGSLSCPAPNGTILTDFSGNMANLLCQLANIFVYPHQGAENLAAQSARLVEGNPPFSYVFDVFGQFSSQASNIANATSSDLSISFGNVGVGNIVPTSSIKIIDNTAFAMLTGNASTSADLHNQVFSFEDIIFTLGLVGTAVKLIFF